MIQPVVLNLEIFGSAINAFHLYIAYTRGPVDNCSQYLVSIFPNSSSLLRMVPEYSHPSSTVMLAREFESPGSNSIQDGLFPEVLFSYHNFHS